MAEAAAPAVHAAPRPDLLVIGAGAFGMWTALAAAEAGAAVTLADMAGVGNVRASSGGASRNIRAAYGGDAFYTRLAMDAWAAWREREAQFGTRLLFETGAVRTGNRAMLEAQARVFAMCGQPYEALDAAAARRRWPPLRYADGERLFFEPRAGIVLAGGAMTAAARRFTTLGGTIVVGRVAVAEGDGDGGTVFRLGGERVDAGRIVVAAGPWLPGLFPRLLAPLMRTPRRELFFFASPPDNERFDWRHLPNLADGDGWTSSNIGGGLKVAPVMRHIALDPDDDPGPPTPRFAAAARAYLARRLPALAGAPLAGTYVGQLENTASEDFIIDTHPDDPRIVIAGGGSGHAFKFGPILGPAIARFALDGALPPVWRRRFALGAHRAVAPDEAG